jgi:predicted dehydrogenase
MNGYTVGIVGLGFIGKVHLYGYRNLPFYYPELAGSFEVTAAATSRRETAAKAGREHGIPLCTTDYTEITENPEIDIVHICTPNNLHLDQLLSAMKHGKHIYCDKPLVVNAAEAGRIENALSQGYSGTFAMTFQNRFFPATMYARHLMDGDFVGRVLTFRAAYLHSGSVDPAAPLKWKLSSDAGGGVIQDLASHALDLMNTLIGDYTEVCADSRIAYPTRPAFGDPARRVRVDAEDDVAIMCVAGGDEARGVIEACKIATGTEDELRFEIHGTHGALRFNSLRPSVLEVYRQAHAVDGDDSDVGFADVWEKFPLSGWTAVDTVQRYPAPAAAFPSPKNMPGWIRGHAACLADFLYAVRDGRSPEADARQGIYIQRVIQAVQDSARDRKWIKVPGR